MGFVSIIIGIFTAIKFIIKFVKDFLLKYATHAVILGVQFTITASVFVFIPLFYVFVVTTFVALYNRAIWLLDYITHPSFDGLSCFYGFLQCSGISPAIDNGISLFFTALGTVMLFHLGKFTISTLNILKNELFKLGVLLGQAVD